jgi:hypothetical protein
LRLKREKQMIQNCAFKDKRKGRGEGRPQLGGQWKVPNLVALEMNPMLECQWGGILLGGQWKVLSLVALEMSHVWLFLEGEGKALFSHPFTFHPIRFYLNIFSIDFKVLFYHGSKPLFHVFPSFSLLVNYNYVSQSTKSSTHSSPS